MIHSCRGRRDVTGNEIAFVLLQNPCGVSRSFHEYFYFAGGGSPTSVWRYICWRHNPYLQRWTRRHRKQNRICSTWKSLWLIKNFPQIFLFRRRRLPYTCVKRLQQSGILDQHAVDLLGEFVRGQRSFRAITSNKHEECVDALLVQFGTIRLFVSNMALSWVTRCLGSSATVLHYRQQR